MAVGVPEAEVFAAADRVLERGERPTVERVRLDLGRGSPARVGQLLEAWWDALARRLAGETRLPELPKAASAAFTELWRVATDEARGQLETAMAERRTALDAEAAQWVAEKADWADWADRLEQTQAECAAAIDVRVRAEARLDDLQRLLTQHEAEHADDVLRLATLSDRAEMLEQERRDLAERLTAREAAAAQERDAAASHLRKVEDRANVEIDRARQEVKGLREHLEQVEHEASQTAQAAQQRESEARQCLARSEQSAAEQRARVRALEEQLARLDGLGEALRSAQEAVRTGLEREAQLRIALDKATRATTALVEAPAKKFATKKASSRKDRS
ncbi:MAG: DNA-binding protein [Pseudomonadota bacterium]